MKLAGNSLDFVDRNFPDIIIGPRVTFLATKSRRTLKLHLKLAHKVFRSRMFPVCPYLEVRASAVAPTRLVTIRCFHLRRMVSRMTNTRMARRAPMLECHQGHFIPRHQPGDMLALHRTCMVPRQILFNPARRFPTRWLAPLGTMGHPPWVPMVNSSRHPHQDRRSKRRRRTRDPTEQTYLSFTSRIILRIWTCINYSARMETC